MTARRIVAVTGLTLLCLVVAEGVRAAAAQTKPEGEMRFALYVTISSGSTRQMPSASSPRSGSSTPCTTRS